MKLLPPTKGYKPKREYTNSCTPCLTLKGQVGCRDYCCRSPFITLSQEDLDDGLPVQAPFADLLAFAEDGSCSQFDAVTRTCLAWERRPLDCRLYDCRSDRFVQRRGYGLYRRGGSVDLDRCVQCGAALRLILGAQDLCEGHCICAECGAPYVLQAGRILVAPDQSLTTRRRYLVALRFYAHDWTAVVEAVEAMSALDRTAGLQLQLALSLARLRRFDAALAALDVLGDSAALTVYRSWIVARSGDRNEAVQMLEDAWASIPETLRTTAHIQLGELYRELGASEQAARHFAEAIRFGLGSHDEIARMVPKEKEYLLEMARSGEEAFRRAAEEQLLSLRSLREWYHGE